MGAEQGTAAAPDRSRSRRECLESSFQNSFARAEKSALGAGDDGTQALSLAKSEDRAGEAAHRSPPRAAAQTISGPHSSGSKR